MIKSEKLNYTFFSQVKNVLHSPQDFLLSLHLIKLNRLVSIIIRIILLFFLCLSYFKIIKHKKNNFNFNQLNTLLLTTIFLCFFYSLIFGLFGLMYQLKYLALLFPLFLMSLLLLENYPDKTKHILYSIIALFYLIVAIHNFSTPIKLYDYKTISKYIEKIEEKDEPVVFYRKDIALPFEIYYKGHNLLVPLVNFDFGPDYYKNDLKDTIELKNHINKIFVHNKSLILLTNRIESYIYPNKMNQEMFDHFIDSQYQVDLDTSFHRTDPLHFIQVRRLIKKNNDFPIKR